MPCNKFGFKLFQCVNIYLKYICVTYSEHRNLTFAYLAVALDFLCNNQTCVLILDSKKSAGVFGVS